MTRKFEAYEIGARSGVEVEIAMPSGATIIAIASLDDRVSIWAIGDDKAVYEVRRFMLLNDGHAIPMSGDYIGSTMTRHGTTMMHCVEMLYRMRSRERTVDLLRSLNVTVIGQRLTEILNEAAEAIAAGDRSRDMAALFMSTADYHAVLKWNAVNHQSPYIRDLVFSALVHLKEIIDG